VILFSKCVFSQLWKAFDRKYPACVGSDSDVLSNMWSEVIRVGSGWTSHQNSLISCASEFLTHLCLVDVYTQAVIHSVFCSTCTISWCSIYLPEYLMQMASLNSCLFGAYQIALTGTAESQEEIPFSVDPFTSCASEHSLKQGSPTCLKLQATSCVPFNAKGY